MISACGATIEKMERLYNNEMTPEVAESLWRFFGNTD